MADVTYRTRDGDVLDAIVWRFYGRQTGRVVEVVLEANPHLADLDAVLPVGVDVLLPDVQETEQIQTVRLWD